MHPKDAEGIANSVDPDQTAPLGGILSTEDNKRGSLFPFRLNSFMQKTINKVKYWNINWFFSENNKITWRDKGQVVRFSIAGDWMVGYKCIYIWDEIMIFWCIDNLKNGGYSSGMSVPYKI